MKILICGLPGAGKTTLARSLAPLLNAVHFNADRVRATISQDLDFSPSSRLVQAARMGFMCDIVVDSGHFAIADFICPTHQARALFNATYTIWIDTIAAGRFEDTNQMFEPLELYDLRITSYDYDVGEIARKILGEEFNTNAPTALFIGRYQPFHDGHKALMLEGLRRVGQICIAVRDTHGLPGNPFSYAEAQRRIIDGFGADFDPTKIKIVPLPNITNVFYGRDVGYTIEKIDLDKTLEDISATKIRKDMGL